VREDVTILRASVYEAHHKSFFHRIIAFFSFMLSSFWIGLGVKNVDVVWGTSPPIFQGVTAWVLARVKGAKFLFEVRDLWPQFAIAVGVLRNPVLIALSEWLERFLYTHADQVMVNSPGFIEHVEGITLSGWSSSRRWSSGRSPYRDQTAYRDQKSKGAKRVELIPNSADPSMFDPNDDGAAFRESNGLKDKFVVLYAGAHGMSNDLTVVLESASLLDETNIQIVLLGDGKEKPALMAQAKEMNLTNVTFLPSVRKTEMATALAGADACIAILKPLDEYKTTYPNKVFDYMAAGRPVVLAIDGVIRAVVDAAGCGLFAQPGNAVELARVMRELAKDKVRAREMGLKGRKYLEENFSRTALVEKLEGILEEIIRSRGT
jgi:glycosyltransferase involved in cell wall biosynthesis